MNHFYTRRRERNKVEQVQLFAAVILLANVYLHYYWEPQMIPSRLLKEIHSISVHIKDDINTLMACI